MPDSSVQGISQARILEWVAISFPRGSSQPRDWTWVTCIAGRFFAVWATREAPTDTWKDLDKAWNNHAGEEAKQQLVQTMWLHGYHTRKCKLTCGDRKVMGGFLDEEEGMGVLTKGRWKVLEGWTCQSLCGVVSWVHTHVNISHCIL